MKFLLPAFLSLLPILAAAGKLSVQSPRVVISDSKANILRNEPLSLSHLPSPPLTLGASDRLKFTFQVLEKESEKPVQPHQTFLRFYDPETQEEGIQPLRISSTGKASFELLNLATERVKASCIHSSHPECIRTAPSVAHSWLFQALALL
ncbi:hypothetical protein M422DRAFT_266080 [Sphaerobolus stellatus SS14]|uniref:Ribophorin II third domain-containing protein n=1 Tax=Sphaerobolus stellatus (strain SS14) TaxID=990650 RepID=A0A0C9UBW3_SPHS4|nr:hypothetical protein M422DRAFT_266080 [Sphaerobolus stellatus SS14]